MSKKLKKANNRYKGYRDELTLAELIQNAAARGLHSTRVTLYRDANGQAISPVYAEGGYIGENAIVNKGGALLENPPEGTTCACALGAMALTPKLSYPLNTYAMSGNDCPDDAELDNSGKDPETEPKLYYADERSMQIGLAYEQALRPE